LSRLSGSEFFGRLLRTFALLRTPEELDIPALVARREELTQHSSALPEDGLRYLARHRDERNTHVSGNLARPPDPRGQPDPNAFTAAQKLRDARSLDEALQWLTPIERVEVAGDARLLVQLAALPDAAEVSYTI
jgi:membrane glycosyltransferase